MMSKRNSKAEAPGTPPLASDPSAVGTAEIETVATVDGEGLEEQENEPQPPSFPPYPPYVPEPAPLCVADVVDHGNEMRREHKSKPKQRVKPYPRPAKPWGCAAGSAPMTRRQLLAHLKCLKRHGVVLTDRLTQIAKPSRRTVLSKWRENAEILAPEIIVRYRTLLDADDPWRPDQAYQFFLNMRRTRRKTPCQQKKLSKREMQAICGDKRFTWARNATVALARGIQERLCKPGCFTLNGGMLRLSDIILEELCGYMSVRVPARCSNSCKARFMMEMSDKIAIWIDDILAESDDRMLMMDFDEDDEVAMTMDYPPEDLIADICNVPSSDFCDVCECSAARPSSDLVAKPSSIGKPSSSKCDVCSCSTKSPSKTSKGHTAPSSAAAMPEAVGSTGSATVPVTGSAAAPNTGSATAPATGSTTAPPAGSPTAPAGSTTVADQKDASNTSKKS